jgi:hypothetical protein
MVRRTLRKFKILEISGCDRPAVEPARVAIFKRYDKGQTDMDIAKRIEANGELAEIALHGAAEAISKDNPHLSEAQAFARAYSAPENLELRKAEHAARYQRIGATAPQSAGADASLSIAKRDRAMGALNAKAEELRNMHPSLSKEQAFAKVYKLYPALAKAERAASREAIGA